MAENNWQVILDCNIAPGRDAEQVKGRLAKLFKKQPAQIDKLYAAGKPVVLKNNLSRQQAEKIRASLIAKSGAKIDVAEPSSNSSPKKAPPPPPPTSSVKAGFGDAASGLPNIEDRVGFGRRFGAALLDQLIIFPLGVSLGMVYGRFLTKFFEKVLDDRVMTLMMALAGPSITGIIIAIVILFWSNYLLAAITGASLGKRLLGIRIASADGTRAGLQRLIPRAFLLYFVGLTLYYVGQDVAFLLTLSSIYTLVLIVSCLFVLGRSRMGLHDRLLGTAVYPVALLDGGKPPLISPAFTRIAIATIAIGAIPLAMTRYEAGLGQNLVESATESVQQRNVKGAVPTVPMVRESVKMRKGDVMIFRSADAEAVLTFTRFGKEQAWYQWRYKASNRQFEKTGSGEVFERYKKVATDDPSVTRLEDAGSKITILMGSIPLEWSYSGKNVGWVYYDAGKVKVSTAETSFANHLLDPPVTAPKATPGGPANQGDDWNQLADLVKDVAEEKIHEAATEYIERKKSGKGNRADEAPESLMEVRKIEDFHRLLEDGEDIHARNDDGYGIVQRYVMYNKPELVRAAIEAGADVNVTNDKGIAPINQAMSRFCDAEITKILLDAGADVKHPDPEGITPLAKATWWALGGMSPEEKQRSREKIAILLRYGADPNHKNDWGQAPIHSPLSKSKMVETEAEEVLRTLLEAGGDPNLIMGSSKIKLPLASAADQGRPLLVKALLDYGAKVDGDVLYALTDTYSFEQGHEEVLDLLLDAGADVNAVLRHQKTLLYWAARNNKPKMFKSLLEHGADYDHQGTGGELLILLAKRIRVEMMKLLLDNGADPNYQLENGSTISQMIETRYGDSAEERQMIEVMENAGGTASKRGKGG